MEFHSNFIAVSPENHLAGPFSPFLLYLNVTFSGKPSLTIPSKVFFPTTPTRKMIIASKQFPTVNATEAKSIFRS